MTACPDRFRFLTAPCSAGVLFFFTAIASGAVDGHPLAADQSSVSPTGEVETYLELLQSDFHATRQRAIRGILRLADSSDSRPPRTDRHRELKQALLRHCLDHDLETQLQVARLIEQIETIEYRKRVEQLLETATGDNGRSAPTAASSPLAERWQTFARRAGVDDEAKDAFLQLSLCFGPSLDWPSLARPSLDDTSLNCSAVNRWAWHPDGSRNGMDLVFMSHFGCVAPEMSRRFGAPSSHVLRQLKHPQFQLQLPTLAHINGRIIGRLIDRVLLDNPYGWTLSERMHLSLAYQRPAITQTLCQHVFACDQPLAAELSAAVIAWRQISAAMEPFGSSGRFRSREDRCVCEALSDRRVVCVSPEQLVYSSPAADGKPQGIKPVVAPEKLVKEEKEDAHPNQDRSPNLSGSPAIIRTRVQDVAGWALMQAAGRDVRELGMTSLQADPVWGVRMASIGFVGDVPRSRFLDRVRREIRAAD